MTARSERYPLAPIKNSLYVLKHSTPGGSQARRAQAVIDRQVSQLARLVDDLLDVTRITRNNQLQCERLDLNDLVRRTVEDQGSLFEDSEVRLELTPAAGRVVVNADWNRLAQVVGNLLQNAGKFTSQGGRVNVSVLADAEAAQAEVRVTDTGVGMSPDMLGRLFQPFVQADTTLDRSQGGLGLGLALVKGLIELHGGTVSARSDGLGKGAEFVLRLPLDLRAAPEARKPVTTGDQPPRRVLIIEDNVDAADSLSVVLELGAHAVQVAHSGTEGLAKARQFRPDVVLCDIGLPEMDGYAVARAFRADQLLCDILLVALSGYALPDDLHRAKEAGFDEHMAKPPRLEELTRLLAAAPQKRPSGTTARA